MNQHRGQQMQKSSISFLSVEIRQLDNHENQTELWSFGLEESYILADKA